MATENLLSSFLDQDAIDALPANTRKALEGNVKHLGGALLAPRSRGVNVKAILEFGQKLRDGKLWEYPFLPGAVSVYQQLASGREWMMSGKPRAVTRGIEWVNNAQSVDLTTGMVHVGYESFLRRRVMDYLTIGRTAFVVPRPKAGKPPILEYLDPTQLKFKRQDKQRKGPVSPNEIVWEYTDKRKFRFDEVFLDHPIPIGSSSFMSPLMPIIPTATLAWLIREHHMAQVDGRKIRDILFVANPALKNAIGTAIIQVAALWAGEDVSRIGVPTVEVNNPSNVPVKDLFALLGLSNMPENFDENEFTFAYVNEISANLSLALRHFWNSERTTNKALEEVQEKRGQLKGPATYIRSEQRLMNRPGVLTHIQGGKLRHGFVEEVDSSSRLDNASILLQTTQALGQVAKIFGGSIKLESYLAWMQQLNVLPNDLSLIDVKASNVVKNPDDKPIPDEGEVTGESDPAPTGLSDDVKMLIQKSLVLTNATLDYDEISVSGVSGQVLERRVKVFTVAKLIALQKLAEEDAVSPDLEAEAAMKHGKDAMQSANQILLRLAPHTTQAEIKAWNQLQTHYKKSDVTEAIKACLASEDLSEHHREIVDDIVGRFIDEPLAESN